MKFGKRKKRPVEQRNPGNLYLSLLVDVGVSYNSALGEEAAKDFFARQQVPRWVMTRVLRGPQARRLTEREKHGRPPGPPAGSGEPDAPAVKNPPGN